MNRRRSLKKFLNEFELYLGAAIFILLTILLTLQVILRYVFFSSISWIGELSTILFIWMTYLGVSAASLKGQHLKVDFFIERINSVKLRKWAIVYTDVVTIIFCAFIIFPLLKIINQFTNSGSKTMLLELPKNLIYFVIAFSLMLTIVRLIQNGIKVFKSPKLNDTENNLE